MKFKITLSQKIDYNETIIGESDNYADALRFAELAIKLCKECSVTITAYMSNREEEE